MKTKLNKIVAALAMLFLATASTVQADLLDGQTLGIRFSTFFPPHMMGIDVGTTAVVGPGTELMNFGAPDLGYVDIDFSDTNIVITSRSDRLGVTFTSLGFWDNFFTIPGFASVTVNPATTMSDVSYDIAVLNQDTIGVYFGGGGLQDKQLSLDITAVSFIPEPGSAGLVLVSVLLIARSRRRICADRRYPIA